MVHLDPSQAECRVYTHKEGLLSAVAHDLALRATRFTIDADEGARTVSAVFDARALRVIDAVVDGRETPGALSDADKKKIEASIVDDVLRADAFPEIRFSSSAAQDGDGDYTVPGQLTLCGVTRPITVQARHDGTQWVAEATIHQPDFGIRPYTALLGTLRVRADVRVRVTVPGHAPAPKA